MADSGREPANAHLMACLKDMTTRLITVEKKLGAIDTLEKKVSDFEQELQKVWIALDERVKRTAERVSQLEDRLDNADIGTTEIDVRLSEMEKLRDQLKDEVAYIKSQSMRNNLIFTNVPEDNSDENEMVAVTERKLRDHLHEKLQLAKETADAIQFERVHRTPAQRIHGKVRSIVAKFTFFKDRELVRRQWPKLEGTGCHVFEQFPPEVTESVEG